MIWVLVCSSDCSNCFFRRNAAFAAVTRVSDGGVEGSWRLELPFLLLETCFRASASCSSIWFCRCFSRLFSISSCPRSWRIAFFGASFFCWAPPNQPRPQPLILYDVLDRVSQRCMRARRQQSHVDVRWAIKRAGWRGSGARGRVITYFRSRGKRLR